MRPSLLLVLLCACNDKTTTESGDVVDDSGSSDACTELFDQVTELYADAGELGACTGAGAVVADSIMNLSGITIDNEGEDMTPCVAVRCDADHAYIASNDLSFYDFVAITPNPLAESQWIHRVPLAPVAVSSESSDNVETQDSCVDAYNAWVADPTDATDSEPSGLCLASDTDEPYLYDPDTDTMTQKILCLNNIAATITGAPVFGPNEGHTPFAYGNPGYWYPTEEANDTYYQGMTTALDLCGFHTSDVGHNHAANEVCYELDADNKPVNSYVDVAAQWSMADAIDGDCTEESAIVGWSYDGYPIKGPCVCVARADDGSCETVLRARSSWHYAGLSQWEDHAEADADSEDQLELEGRACEEQADCCPDGDADCEYACTYETFIDADSPGGSTVDKRCVLHDYSWCTHDYVDHSERSPDEAGFVPLDMCNGYEGPDGYAYHATMTFPFFQACYRGIASDSTTNAMLGGGGGMGGEGGGEPGGEGGGEPGGGEGPPPSDEGGGG